MGYQKREVAVVVTFSDTPEFYAECNDINAAWNRACDIIVRSGPHVNGYTTYLFAYDGSKEGWDASDEADALRQRFVDSAKTMLGWPDIAVVKLRDDDGMSSVWFYHEED